MQSLVDNLPTEYQVERFQDIRCLLANLYHFAIAQRKHLKTQKGYQAAMQAEYDPEELNKLQFFLTALLLKFQEKQWKDISLLNTPKLPDIYLLKLTDHQLFEGKPVEDFMSPTISSGTPEDMGKETKSAWKAIHRLPVKQSRVLKELALRLS